MAFTLPNGATVSLATAYGAAKTVTIATNASPPVLTSVAHGLTNGDIIEVTSGWYRANNKTFRVAGVTADTFTLEGLDATSVTLFPAGQGIGSVKKVSTFTKLDQVTGFEPTGGDGQFATVDLLEAESATNIPSGFSAESINITMADDPSLPGFAALKTASDSRALRTLRMLLPSGSAIYYVGYITFNETPTMAKGTAMSVKAAFAQQNRPVRYAS